MMNRKYEKEEGPFPRYEVPKQVSDLTMMFIVAAVIYFLVAGSLAIVMRLIQANLDILNNQSQTSGLFYASLTVHGQVMFFGFAVMLTLGISYYLISKFAKKPLFSMKLAIWSFSTLNAGAIMIIVAGSMFFGAGWYDLMPLTFHPGNGGWSTLSSVVFVTGDALIGVSLTLFSINIIGTVLGGSIATGIQKSEEEYGNDPKMDEGVTSAYGPDDKHKAKASEQDAGSADYLVPHYIPMPVRWVSSLGISAWLPKKYRQRIPAVSIVVVGIFVNSLVQLMGNIGLFIQLANGYSFMTDPNFQPNWLLTKDAWWFFGHPIVYFTLFSFLGAAYYFIPRYSKKAVPYDKWAYRPWPFYLVFTMGVFSHHLFQDYPNPIWLQMFSQASSFGIVFPSGLTIMTILMYIFRSRIKWNITALFMISGIAGWAFGGFAGAETGWWGQDIYLHNTLNIVGHIHLVLLMGSVLLGIGLIYSIVPSITGKNLNKTLGLVHIILTLIGGFGLALMFTYLGFAGVIRREAVIPPDFSWAMLWLLFFAMTVGIGQIIFAYNLFKTIARKHTAEELEMPLANERISGNALPSTLNHKTERRAEASVSEMDDATASYTDTT
jgi:heme/copper-type cytochrome/quinol oxidase subunit 1